MDIKLFVNEILGIPQKYIKETSHKDRVVCLVNRTWLSSLYKNGQLLPFQYHDTLGEEEVEAWLKLGESFGPIWQQVSIRALETHSNKKVIPLPRARPSPATSSSQHLSQSQLLHYVSHTNYKNLWKEAYKKYIYSSDSRETPNISLVSWDTVLLDIVCRTYGCPIVYLGSHEGATTPRSIEPHPNCLPSFCAVFSGSSQPLLLLQPFIAHSAQDCVSFSPALLSSSRSRPLFVIFQLLQLMRDSHDRGLVLGDLTLQDLLLSEGLWLQAVARLQDNLHCPSNYREKRHSSGKTSKTSNDATRISNIEARGLVARTQEERCDENLHQVALNQLLDLWVRGRLSNLDYLTALNCLAGRRFGHPNHHHVLPWVTDFSTPFGGWRDLSRSKFRLNKGDRQLDLTYDAVLGQHSNSDNHGLSPAQIPHHVSDVLSEITYYVYLARRTPRSLLCKYVRPKWVPAEYPSSIQRMQDWTPDECIPEFYTDPSTFKSIHEDLPDLEVPSWASSPEHFIEKHRQALESVHVSERLHHWIDLTFGYKLSGAAAVKSKNVCLYLVDRHTYLSDCGVVQLFTQPHPHRITPSPFWGKVAPKLHLPPTTTTRRKAERSVSLATSPSTSTPVLERSGEEETNIPTETAEEEPRPLSKLLSKSRSSLLSEEPAARTCIVLPKDYNPLSALQEVESLHTFTNQSFYEPPELTTSKSTSSDTVGYRQAVASRRIREMQTLGCLVVELYLSNKMKALLPITNLDLPYNFEDRIQKCLTVLEREWHDLPFTVREAIVLLLQIDESGISKHGESGNLTIKYPTVTSAGLPPPSAHQLLQPLISAAFPFPNYFEKLYSLLLSLYKLQRNEEESAEKQIEIMSRELPTLLPTLDSDGLDLLLPHVRALLCSPAATNAAWQLFDPISKALGPNTTVSLLLDPICALFENGGVNSAKLYHRSFLLKLIVRLGLHVFLNNFATALVEAVGGYRDQHSKTPTEQGPSSDQQRHKSVPLKSASMGNLATEAETGILSPLDEDSSADSERLATAKNVSGVEKQAEGEETDAEVEPEVFVFESNEEDEDNGNKQSSPAVALDLMAQLELDMKFDQEADGTSPLPGNPEEDAKIDEVPSPSPEPCTELPSIQHQQEWRSPRKPISECPVSEMSADSILWLAHRLGPVLTAKHLSRNLLRMLSLCYLGEDSLSPTDRQDACCSAIPSMRLVGDENAAKVTECLTSIAALYGEQLVVSQYFSHISELIALCKRKLTANLEGGLIGCLALLRHIVPYLSDATLMDQISDILKTILHPAVRLVATTRAPFPSGTVARTALAFKLLEALYVISLRIGTDMTRLHLASTLQRFFLAFDKAFDRSSSEMSENRLAKSVDENCFLEVKRDGSTTEWAIKGSPLQISHARIRENDSADSFSPPAPIGNQDASKEIRNKAIQELKTVFTERLAHCAYLPFFRFIGENVFEQFLKNEPLIRELCYEYEQQNPRLTQCKDPGHMTYLSDYLPPEEDMDRGTSGSFGSNVAVIGNRIELQRPDIPSTKPICTPTCSSVPQEDVMSLISKKMDNTSRHLRGNWLAYWEHEIGRAEKDNRFNFKQIKLQQFTGHTNSVRALYVLDNENSFMSGSRDKTVKLWSLRSQGDGTATSSCQWTYSHHRKSVLAIAFLESMRLVASCDSVVHLWDPFMGAVVCQLDGNSAKTQFPPVNVLKAMPAPSCCLLAATTDSTLRVIDARTCSYVQELKVAPTTAGLIRCVAVGSSGHWVAIGQSSGHLSLLDIRTGMVLASWKGHEGEVLQLVTANDSTVVSSSLDQSVAAWSTDNGNLKFQLKGPTEPVHCLNSYGSELISGTTANRIGVHTSVGDHASFSSNRLRSDTFKGVLTAMGVLPLNRLLLLGSDSGHISLLC